MDDKAIQSLILNEGIRYKSTVTIDTLDQDGKLTLMGIHIVKHGHELGDIYYDTHRFEEIVSLMISTYGRNLRVIQEEEVIVHPDYPYETVTLVNGLTHIVLDPDNYTPISMDNDTE